MSMRRRQAEAALREIRGHGDGERRVSRSDDTLLRGSEILTDAVRQRVCRDRRANGIVLASPVETTPEGRQLLKLLGLPHDTNDKRALATSVSAVFNALAKALIPKG